MAGNSAAGTTAAEGAGAPAAAAGPGPEAAAALAALIEAHAGLEGPLLPLLHAVQARFGHVPDWVMQPIAEGLGLGRAEVHGVVTFYPDLRRAPPGRHILRLCRAEACQAMGGQALAEEVQRRLGIGWHQTTPDGRVTLEPVFCLGLCACAPAAMLDGRPVGRAQAALCAAIAP